MNKISLLFNRFSYPKFVIRNGFSWQSFRHRKLLDDQSCLGRRIYPLWRKEGFGSGSKSHGALWTHHELLLSSIRAAATLRLSGKPVGQFAPPGFLGLTVGQQFDGLFVFGLSRLQIAITIVGVHQLMV